MAETQDYKRWLASAPTNRVPIETIQVYHAKWGDLWLANWDTPISALLEDGSTRPTFQASRFYMSPASVADGTEQSTTLTISSLEGRLYEELKAMTPSDRNTPVTITYRMWFHDDLDTPLVAPPPVWTLHAVEATFDRLIGEIRSTPLRTRRLGIYYTKTEFPVLVYAT